MMRAGSWIAWRDSNKLSVIDRIAPPEMASRPFRAEGELLESCRYSSLMSTGISQMSVDLTFRDLARVS
jgi:hypothetical protein